MTRPEEITGRRWIPPTDEDHCGVWEFTGGQPCAACVKLLWIDHEDGIWLESGDGQRLVVPREARAMVAKMMREIKQ